MKAVRTCGHARPPSRSSGASSSRFSKPKSKPAHLRARAASKNGQVQRRLQQQVLRLEVRVHDAARMQRRHRTLPCNVSYILGFWLRLWGRRTRSAATGAAPPMSKDFGLGFSGAAHVKCHHRASRGGPRRKAVPSCIHSALARGTCCICGCCARGSPRWLNYYTCACMHKCWHRRRGAGTGDQHTAGACTRST